MKTLRIFSLTTLLMAVAILSLPKDSFAQAKSATLKVSGECGMCKKKIEKAAKDAGATYALWNKDTKILTIKYTSASTNTAKIEKKIAGVGYDTPDFKASDEAYNNLEKCCQYEREGVNKDEAANTKMDCSKTKMDCSTKDASGKKAMDCSDGKANCCSKKTQQ